MDFTFKFRASLVEVKFNGGFWNFIPIVAIVNGASYAARRLANLKPRIDYCKFELSGKTDVNMQVGVGVGGGEEGGGRGG